jgi:polysaccharide deacetylase family protein (PEP-CTERM system associated)
LNSNLTKRIILSFDVEHWYTGLKYRGISGWQADNRRDHKNIESILYILEKYGSRATFFITGQYAEDYPDIVKTIHKEKHEIACHGYSHEYIYNHSPEGFQEETINAKAILSNLINKQIYGYRAASWSITKESIWALNIIHKAGFVYDSSIYPTKNKRYGLYSALDTPYLITFPD